MNINLRAPNNTDHNGSDDSSEDAKKKVLNLSVTQIAGGALAAMTAAALGSTLGVAGTVAGAAVASVTAGVAGSLYTASLRTGSDRVRTVLRGKGTDGAAAPGPSVASDITTDPNTLDESQVAPKWDPLPLERPASKRSAGSFPWKRAIAVSLSVFVLAAVLITGYERVSGEPLSGGTGTTVSRIGNDSSAGSDDGDPGPKPGATPSSSTPSATESAPSESASEPEAQPSESAESPSASESAPETAPSATAG